MSQYEDFDADAFADGEDRDTTGKVILAALAGAAAGAVVGLLLAPDKGANTVASLRATAGRYGEQLEGTLKKYVEKLEDLGVAGTGVSLMLKGDWNELKGQLKSQYADLTDDDLTYAEGQGDTLVGNIQRRLGKTKREVVQLLNDLG